MGIYSKVSKEMTIVRLEMNSEEIELLKVFFFFFESYVKVKIKEGRMKRTRNSHWLPSKSQVANTRPAGRIRPSTLFLPRGSTELLVPS